jgi:hypothetical protein
LLLALIMSAHAWFMASRSGSVSTGITAAHRSPQYCRCKNQPPRTGGTPDELFCYTHFTPFVSLMLLLG